MIARAGRLRAASVGARPVPGLVWPGCGARPVSLVACFPAFSAILLLVPVCLCSFAAFSFGCVVGGLGGVL